MIGSGGCMRELAWQKEKWNIIGYVDINRPISAEGIRIGTESIPYLGDDSYFEKIEKPVNVIVSIGSSAKRKSIVEKLEKNFLIRFPNIILKIRIYGKGNVKGVLSV